MMRTRTSYGPFIMGMLGVLGAALLSQGCATPDGASSPEASGFVEERAQVDTADLYGPGDGVVTPEPARGGFAEGQTPLEDSYRLSAGDLLEFRSFDDEGLSREAIVRYDGCVSLPLVPDLRVTGLTRPEAEDLLREAYGKIFREPQVTLLVLESTSRAYYVIGDVERPSEYPYGKPLSVLQAINIAGGVRSHTTGGSDGLDYATGYGTLSKVFIIRHVSGQREVLECDLSDLMMPGAHPSDTPIYPDDVVYVPEGMNLVYII